jgi:hypothetical protein
MMAIKGVDRYENLSVQGGPREGAPVRFGDFVVPSATAWVMQPVGNSPKVRAEFEMRDGSAVCLSITVEATPKGRPVTTSDLESLPGLDRKGIDAFKALGTRVFDDDDWKAGVNSHRLEAIRRPSGLEVGRALRGRPDDELSRVAAVYRENIKGSPAQAVELAFGWTRRTADRRIRAARDRGLLPPTTRGKKRA